MINVELKHETPSGVAFKVLKSVKFEWPDLWDELKDNQYFAVVNELESEQNPDQAQIKIFFEITKCPRAFVFKRMKLDEFKIQIIDQLVIPFLENRRFTKGILMHSFSGFEGMDDVFKNFTWAQYCLVDQYFINYNKGQKELLDNVCALIYKEENKPFSGKVAEQFLPFWSEQLEHVKLAVLLHYSELKLSVSKMYPYLFPKKPIETEMNPSQFLNTPAKSSEIDYHAATISLSGGPFGTREQLEKEPVHNVFKYLDMKAKEEKSKKKP
jgi:hypothetical protein